MQAQPRLHGPGPAFLGQQFPSGSVSAMPQESNCVPLDAWSADHKSPAWDLTLLIAMTRASNIVGESMTRR